MQQAAFERVNQTRCAEQIDGDLAEALRRAAAALGQEPEDLLRQMIARGLDGILTPSRA